VPEDLVTEKKKPERLSDMMTMATTNETKSSKSSYFENKFTPLGSAKKKKVVFNLESSTNI
jgi:hypothetical protein